MPDGSEPIADDELLYRRISPAYYDPENDPFPSPLSFRPHELDRTGLSVSRAKYKTIEEVAINPRGTQYYVAVLRAGDLRALGIDVVPRPEPDDPGHAEIPSLTNATRDETWAKEYRVLLAERLCRSVEGPFPSEAEAR